jgi:hypothetical protein
MAETARIHIIGQIAEAVRQLSGPYLLARHAQRTGADGILEMIQKGYRSVRPETRASGNDRSPSRGTGTASRFCARASPR